MYKFVKIVSKYGGEKKKDGRKGQAGQYEMEY